MVIAMELLPLLLLLLLMAVAGDGCIDLERTALLAIKSDINGSDEWLTSGSDCCRWSGVTCGGGGDAAHVIKLDFHNPRPVPAGRSKLNPSISNLTHLLHLDLSGHDFGSSIPPYLFTLTSLTNLSLRSSGLQGAIPDSIGNLRNLQRLELQENSLTGTLPTTMSALCSLRILDLSHNSIGGSVAPLLSGLARSNRSSASLAYLSLRDNRFNGTIPESLGNFSSLAHLDLSSNSFTGVLTESHAANLTSLDEIDLSFNSFEIRASKHWIPPFNASSIRLCACKMGSDFPAWLRTQKKMSIICASDAGISGKIPSWFRELLSYQGSRLNLSHNGLTGRFPSFFQTKPFECIDVSYNRFQGRLPLLNPEQLTILSLSNNFFTGSIHQNYAEFPLLQVLDLSHNQINGSIPSILITPRSTNRSTQLRVLDLSDNQISGVIPSALGSLVQLQFLHLRRNSLYESIPVEISHCSNLLVLDLRGNSLSGIIPPWIGEKLHSLRVLSLRQNHFIGHIPTELSLLASLQVLDLSHNNLSGTLPPTLGNLTAMVRSYDRVRRVTSDNKYSFSISQDVDFYYKESILVARNGDEYVYSTALSLVISIDLSGNYIFGGIPGEWTRLSRLVFLNLSSNHLTGRIPERIGEMRELELLDLSANELTGEIPRGLSDLNFLSQLNLSMNGLSGRIPSGTQIQGLEPSVFEGNPGLCGPPLAVRCGVGGSVSRGGEEGDGEGEGEGDMVMWVYLGFEPGIVAGCWGFLGVMMVTKRRRERYVRFLDAICDWICKFTGIASGDGDEN